MNKCGSAESFQALGYRAHSNVFVKMFSVGMLVLISYLPNYTLAEDYYWRIGGTGWWLGSSAEEVCQKWLNQTKRDYAGVSPGTIFFNLRVESNSSAPNNSAHRICKVDIVEPTGPTITTAYRYVNLYGDSCSQGKTFNTDNGTCVEGPHACSTNPSLNNSVTPVRANPVNVLTGGKTQQFTDLKIGGLKMIRSFKHSGENAGWSFNFQESLFSIRSSDKLIYIHQYMGRKDTLREVTPQCWRSTGSQCYKIETNDDTHILVSSNQKKQFDKQGRILKKSNLAGEEATSYVYSANTIQIEKNNRSIGVQLDPDNNVISISSGSDSITYQYADNGMIEHVIGADQRDDYYLYGGAKSNLLIEYGADGVMFARWNYDANNRVVLSEHAGGVDRYTFAYPESVGDGNTVVEVTNQLDKKTIFKFTEIAGTNRLTEVEGVETPSCIGATRGFTYHPNGNVASESDNKGNTTSYQYNTRNLESSRTEALGTPQERTIITEWHPTFNLRTKITELGRETNFIYDAEGRLLSQSSNELPLN